MTGGGAVEVRFTKWGGTRHWRFPLEPLGSDGHGWWLGGRTGILLRRGYEEPIGVHVLDGDEFEEHRIRFGYPSDLVARARATTDELVARITAGDEPFGVAGAAWLRALIGTR